MSDDEIESLAQTRAAPTRKRNYLQVDYNKKQDECDSPSRTSRTNNDEQTGEVLRSDTGKKNKKETTKAETGEEVHKLKTDAEEDKNG